MQTIENYHKPENGDREILSEFLYKKRRFRDKTSTSEKIDRLKDEMELLGFTVSGHPLELWPDVPWETYCPICEIGSYAGRRVTICGLVIADRFHQQNDGQPMKFLSLCDHTGMLETEMFATAFRRFGMETLRHPVLEITGTVTAFEGNRGFSLRIEAVRRPRRKASVRGEHFSVVLQAGDAV